MELQRGTCFICPSNSVIQSSDSQKAYNIISLLLSKEILNPTEFCNVQTNLRMCPICYHKLIIMKQTSKNVKENTSKEVPSDHCLLCRRKENLFRINNWPTFSAISKDVALSENKNCITCSDCLFYLEMKNELKTKLFSKYPQLEKKLKYSKNKKTWKLKFIPNLKLQSTPLPKRDKLDRISKRKKSLETITISSDDDSELEEKINLNSLKNLKPLKNHKLYKINKVAKKDSKFFNQIPYVLINNSNLSNIQNNNVHSNTISGDAVIKYIKKRKNENCKVPFKDILSAKRKNALVKHGIKKHLIVNVSRMKIDKYQEKLKSDADIQNLIDKFSILQSPIQTKEHVNNSYQNNVTEAQDSFIEEIDTSFEIKNKRKSVSFADDKNVEIEYFENRSNVTLKDSGNLDEDSEVVSKKYSKGILKREENTEEQNKEADTNEKNSDTSKKEIQEGKENTSSQQKVDNEVLKMKIKNRRNSSFNDETILSDTSGSGSDDENLSQVSKKSKHKLIQKETEDVNTRDKEKQKDKKYKPRPLSKKKALNTIAEDTINSSDNDPTDSEDTLEKSDDPTDTENTKDNIGLVSVDEKVENRSVRKEKPKPLSKKRKNVENIEDADKEINFKNATSEDDEIGNESLTENKRVKREKPKPLSKKKKLNVENTEEADKEINSKNVTEIVNKDDETGNKIVKKEKPKPLSKKKKLDKSDDSNAEITLENNLNCGNDKDNLDHSNEEKSTYIKNISAEVNEMEHNQNTDKTIESDNTTEANISINSEKDFSSEKEKDSLSSRLEDPGNNSSIISECEKLDETDESEIIDKDSEENSNKSDSPSDVSLLINKYLNDSNEGNSSLLNIQKDDTLEDESINHSSDLIQAEKGKVADESELVCNRSNPVDSFNEFEKNDNLDISEADKDNINSILSNIFPTDLPKDKVLETKNDDNIDTDPAEDASQDLKRKSSDDELDTSKERKKKKVTFCDEVT